MFRFDIKKLKVQIVHVEAVTEALGGSIRVVDEELYHKQGLIKTYRIPIPYALARTFKKRNKGKSKYYVPVQMALVWYEDTVVCIEKRGYQAIIDDNGNWEPNVSYVLRRKIPDIIAQNEKRWYTDGVTVYCMPANASDPQAHEKLTKDGRFYAVTVRAFRFGDMSEIKLIEHLHTRSCVAFVSKKGIIFSPALWTNVMDIRGSQIVKSKQEGEEKNDGPRRFDIINDKYMVNLEFVLNAAKSIGNLFGYEQIAFLQLERHMITLNTVNLPKVPKARRATYDTQLPFLISLAWVMGFIDRCETLTQYTALRALVKVLCQNGLFDRERQKKSLDIEPPSVVSKDEALSHVYQKYSDEQLSIYWMNGGKFPTDSSGDVQQFLAGSAD